MFLKFIVPASFCVCLIGSAAITLASDSDLAPQSTPAQSETAKSGDAKSENSKAAKVPALYTVEQQMIEQTNAQRAKYGLPPLVVDLSLEKTARSHTIWMTNNHALQHTTDNVGENIAMGQHTTDEAVNDWMNSPGHRANILNTSYKRTGVAAYRTPDGTIYWCQQFLP